MHFSARFFSSIIVSTVFCPLTLFANGKGTLEQPYESQEKVYTQAQEGASKPYGAWVLVHANQLKQEAHGTQAGFKASTLGGGFGFDWKMNQKALLGVGLRADTTDLNSDLYSGTDMDFTGGKAFIFARYDVNPRWFIQGALHYGFNSYNTRRRVALPSEVVEANGDITGNQWGGELFTGYQGSWGKWHFLPQVGLQYTHLSLDSYNEHNAGTSNRQFGDQSFSALKWVGDLKIAYQNEFPEAQLLPYIHGKILYDSKVEQQEWTADVFGGPTAFPTFNIQRPHTSYEAGVGFTLFGKHDVTLNMAYDYRFKKRFYDHAVSINVHHAWDKMS